MMQANKAKIPGTRVQNHGCATLFLAHLYE